MNVLLFGATGMVGAGVLLECLDSTEVRSVTAIGRRASGVAHPKLTELLVDDLFDLSSIQDRFTGCDACFFCIGTSVVGLSEDEYRHVTYELTMSVARSVHAAAPNAVFVYVTGEGTDSSERGRSMWARVKGKTENDLLALGFRKAFMFRPGLIQPLRGVRSKTRWYQAIYTMLGPVSSVLRRIAPRWVTTTVDLGRAMIRAAAHGAPKTILNTRDINELASQAD